MAAWWRKGPGSDTGVGGCCGSCGWRFAYALKGVCEEGALVGL